MKKQFDTLGVMIDMSRNAVMSPEALKRFLPLLQKMGYNCVMLYTEDTYEVMGEPYFGYMRGRYSVAEMKEIDAFAAGLGITVIPCIQTLAHLNAAFRWGTVPRDCNDILLLDDERTYQLIERMFATLSDCFTARKIHVGMDEAHMLGRGKYLDLHGYEDIHTLMRRHLDRICAIAERYGYEVLLWSDMYFRPWNGGTYTIPKCEIPQEIVASLPPSVTPVYWDYYQTDVKVYSDMIENHLQLSDKTWFAGGAWCWSGFVPHNRFTLDSMLPAIRACLDHGVRNVLFTMWGDDGAECSHFAQLPALFYLAEYAKGNCDEATIKKKFERLVGIGFDEFMQIECPNDVPQPEKTPRNPSKYMLYADCLCDFLDYTVTPGAGAIYAKYAKDLHTTAKKSRRFGYVFESAARLCEVMEIKYELGLRTRTAYEARDKKELLSLAQNDYPAVIRRIRAFARAFECQWMRDNKPHGFDVQHQRIGGLLFRLEACQRRLLAFANGKIDRIDELEETLLPFREQGESTNINKAPVYATPNVIHMGAVPK